MKPIIIIGSGGHSGVVVDAIRKREIFKIESIIEELDGATIVGDKTKLAFIAIGDNAVRERLYNSEFNFNCNVLHPTAILGVTLKIQIPIGSFFGANSFIGNNSTVGNFTIINTGVILEHDSIVGDFSHLCPGVVTGGRVKIGSRTTIGLGAMIRDGITIGDNVIVGMGSVVTKNVPDNSVVWGNPARLQK